MENHYQDIRDEVALLSKEFQRYRAAFARGTWFVAWVVALQWGYLAFDIPVRLKRYQEIFADFDTDLPRLTLAFFAIPTAGYLAILGSVALFAVVKEVLIKDKVTSLGISLALGAIGFVFQLLYREAMLTPFARLIQGVSQ